MKSLPDGCKPFDRRDLRPCNFCGKTPMQDGNIWFYEIRLRQCVADITCIRENAAMRAFFNGAGGIADVFTSTNVAASLPERRILVCASCMTSETPIACLMVEDGSDD